MKKKILAAFADEAGSDLSAQIRALKDNQISFLEIRHVNRRNITDFTTEETKELRKELDNAGISVWSMGSPFGKISITEDFQPHLDRFCHGLELAQILGTHHLRLFSFFIPANESPKNYQDTVLERLSRFLEAAKGSGILLCHENEKGIFGATAENCEIIHKQLPELRGVFDPANFVQCGENIVHAWERLEPYVEYLHIKDALSDGTVVPPGGGEGQLPWLLERYPGSVLTLEPHLTAFFGRNTLERQAQPNSEADYHFTSQREAFDVAVAALNRLLNQEGKN